MWHTVTNNERAAKILKKEMLSDSDEEKLFTEIEISKTLVSINLCWLCQLCRTTPIFLGFMKFTRTRSGTI